MPKRVFNNDEKDTLRLTMLEAGFPLLKEYGMTHTTISKLTEAAGIAKGTFYHFWKDKEHYMSDLILSGQFPDLIYNLERSHSRFFINIQDTIHHNRFSISISNV